MGAAKWAKATFWLPKMALAASLQVAPVYIESSGGPAQIVLSNSGDQPIYAQVRIFDWAVRANDDQLSASHAMLASPPMLKLAPGAHQVVRVVRVASAPLAAEENYRLWVDEVTQTSATKMGVNVMFRYSLPAFVTPPGTAPAAVEVQARLQSRQLTLDFSNTGGRYARIGAVTLVARDGSLHVLDKGLLGYVFAHGARSWQRRLPAAWDEGNFKQVQLDVNGQTLTAAL